MKKYFKPQLFYRISGILLISIGIYILFLAFKGFEFNDSLVKKIIFPRLTTIFLIILGIYLLIIKIRDLTDFFFSNTIFALLIFLLISKSISVFFESGYSEDFFLRIAITILYLILIFLLRKYIKPQKKKQKGQVSS